ncbi:MAG: hypothetical protein ACM3TU_02470 [Bacillota bacterium]
MTRTIAIILLVLALIGALIWISERQEFGNDAKAPSVSPGCRVGECPFEITEADSGKTFTYTVTSRFTLILDETKHPQQELSCVPAGILGSISNIPAVSPPSYAARFEGVAPGTCTFSDRDFTATITIVP